MATSRSIICRDRTGSDAQQRATQPGLELAANLSANWPIFSCFPYDFRCGAIALQFSPKTPRNIPNSRWLVRFGAGRHWTRKSRVSPDFRRIFRDFCMSMDVAGRLWRWDGWPPHSVSNRLFVRGKYILIPFEGLKQGQKRHGFLRTSLDVP
jgi:hypothetical protein